jgi:hypothetical protein
VSRRRQFKLALPLVTVAVGLSGYAVDVMVTSSAGAAAGNPIVVENQQPGTGAWLIGLEATDSGGQIKGYASLTSVNAGGSVTFYVTVNPAQTYTIDVYRIGWYQGLGGRLMQHVGPLNGVQQPACPEDATTGMIACNWSPSYTLTTQTSWTSGIYLALLINSQGYQNYIVFVVRDDSRTAALLYQEPVTTYQAYNDYPNDGKTGKSLYEYNSYGPNTITGTVRAAKVSFDRPYAGDGSSQFLWWEINLVRYLERSGYDVSYSTDIDTHSNGARLLSFRTVLSAGHDEYWSRPMYDAATAARDNGVNLAFFGADPIAWQARFESSSTGAPNRVLVCYKDATIDPISDSSLKTVAWRDDPLNRPEQTLVGVQYTAQVQNGGYVSYVVSNSTSWVYAGTGFKDGDSVPGIVGYEGDRLFSTYPAPPAVAGTETLLSHSPFTTVSKTSDYQNSSIYQAASGAWVFAAGTDGWSWALDSYGDRNLVDARIQQTTANILDRFVGGSANPDFALSTSPTSQTTTQGSVTSYTVTITPSNGFTGQISLNVSGLPGGATATFNPNPATSTSSLSITTSSTTPTGTYPITITGTSGSLTHTTTASLTVTAAANADFTITASPASQSAVEGTTASYSVTITPGNGFNGQVTLSVTGLPKGATATFNPNPAGTGSTLTIALATSTKPGNNALTITGTSGALTHTATVSLLVKKK